MSRFQEKFDPRVWQIVAAIPAGRVMGYGEVARAAGFPRYSRMVGASLGRSPEPLPWFRVVRSNRTLAFEVGSKFFNIADKGTPSHGITIDQASTQRNR